MGKFIIGLIFILAALAGAYYYFSGKSLDRIEVGSQAFLKGSTIPQKYTCDGDNVSPALSIDRVPGDAKSLVLIIEDIDSSTQHQAGGAGFTHWSVFNIDPGRTDIEEGKIPNALEGRNDFGELTYSGPCPPADSSHNYFFRVYALDTILGLDEGVKRADLDAAMQGHIIAKGETHGKYEKKL